MANNVQILGLDFDNIPECAGWEEDLAWEKAERAKAAEVFSAEELVVLTELKEQELYKAENHLSACQNEMLRALSNELHQMKGCIWPGYIWHWARSSDDVEKDIDQTKAQIESLKNEIRSLRMTQVDGSFLDDLDIDLEF